MAIFHLHCSSGGRQRGHSAVAKVLYIRRQGRYAHGRDDLVSSDSANLPPWCDGDPVRLFAAADRFERANGRLFIELEGALPVELELEQQNQLVREFMGQLAPRLPFAYAIHAGQATPGKPQNVHFHLIASERINDRVPRDARQWFRRANPRNPAAGGAPKMRSLKAHGWVHDTRHLYERLVNGALARAGRPERVTADSHRTRITRAEAVGDQKTVEYLLLHPPGMHIGPAAAAIERGSAGRPGRATERGELARAGAANAALFRAEIEHVERELREHGREAVAAARDAGVDKELITAAQSGDPDMVIALDDATEERRQEISAAARTLGFSNEALELLRREAEPDRPDLGWGAVVAATAQRRKRLDVAESAARNVGLDLDAVYAGTEERVDNPVEFLERATAKRTSEIGVAAQSVLFNDKAIARIRREAEAREAGSGWAAVVEATTERRQRLDVAESAARNVGLDLDAVYAGIEERVEDPVEFLERATAKRTSEIVVAAQSVLLNDKAIARIRRKAEAREAGSGWGAVVEAATERRQRKHAAESAARNAALDREAVYRKAGERGEDPVDFLERATAKRTSEIVVAARAVLLDDKAIARIIREAESREAESGFRAVVDATAERRQRKEAAEFAAQSVRLDVVEVRANMLGWDGDPLDFLEQETAKREAKIMALVGECLDDEEIARVYDEAESTRVGSGWGAVVQAAAESPARQRIDGSAVNVSAQDRGKGQVALLERASSTRGIMVAAREVFLDDNVIVHIFRDAESKEPGSGADAVVEATKERRQRKAAAESAARSVGLDPVAAYENVQKLDENRLDFLERTTSTREAEIMEGARAVFLDDNEIERIRGEAESIETGSGWRAVVEVTEERRQRKDAAESAARSVGLELAAVFEAARKRDENRLDFLERTTSTREAEIMEGGAGGLPGRQRDRAPPRRGGVDRDGLGMACGCRGDRGAPPTEGRGGIGGPQRRPGARCRVRSCSEAGRGPLGLSGGGDLDAEGHDRGGGAGGLP